MDSVPSRSVSGGNPSDASLGEGRWIVIGLGNPGEEYAETLHNVGFRVLDILADRWSRRPDDPRPARRKVGPDARKNVRQKHDDGQKWSRQGAARVTRWRPSGAGVEVVLVKPSTFMNRTGSVLPELFSRYGSDARLLVVSDDLALPVGRLRIREKGSAGGHNGLKSINSAYGSDQYVRVRVGIQTDAYRKGSPDTSDYVLSPVPKRDRETLEDAEQLAADAVEAVISEGVVPAMSRYNGVIAGGIAEGGQGSA